ncbi:hypothetical protein EW145_g6861 [Phellinidium pouzarii]|uniref:F-box domain-containing protein n=1 Tax=Phellinidium pouzarii TaxID=167371 RepID=A0A4S4KTQ8_9AGAM|nr:hypothetical protein EW145_g6861 [Phellinidium pouzarii]
MLRDEYEPLHGDYRNHDIVIYILSVLSVWDLLHVRQTSRRLETMSHVRSVWSTIFMREVIETGRPIPGYSFHATPRLLSLCGLSKDDSSPFSIAPQSNDYLDFIESSDLEARTLHALRLEKRWKAITANPSELRNVSAFGTHPTSKSFEFNSVEPVCEVFLLPGGRYVVSTHHDRLRCWDLGLPQLFRQDQDSDQLVKNHQAARCVGEWILPNDMDHFTSLMDAREHTNWQRDSSVCIAICSNNEPVWSATTSAIPRHCAIVSTTYDPLRAPSIFPFDAQENTLNSPVSVFSDECSILLPTILPTPMYLLQAGEPVPPEKYGPQRFACGKLGNLIHVHGHLLFFASFIPPTPNAEGMDDGSILSARYVGIEAIDWTVSGHVKSALLEFPDPQFGEYIGMHVHESAEHVVVVWQNCVGLYPIPHLSSSPKEAAYCSSEVSRPYSSSPSLESDTVPERVVYMPAMIFALSEAVERPIAFSACKAMVSGPDTQDTSDCPRSLTILARSLRNPHLTVQTMLTAFPVPSGTSVPSNSSSAFTFTFTFTSASDFVLPSPKFRFHLTRIPSPMPHAFTRYASQAESVWALALGASGRGLRADTGGALYRCSRADVVLPRFAGPDFGELDSQRSEGGACGARRPMTTSKGLVATVDFWPYRRVDSLPGVADRGDAFDGRLVVRFDEGMGRIVAACVSGCAEGVGGRTITVIDFA